MRRSARAVAQDDEVGLERFEVPDRVLQRLALLQRTGLRREVDDVGAQSNRRELEADAGAGARLNKEIDDRLADEGETSSSGVRPGP